VKRFSETLIWQEPWFRRMSAPAKLLWHYLVAHCDLVGLVDVDFELVSQDCRITVTDANMSEIGDRVQVLGSGRYFIRKFIPFQYGALTRTCPPHRRILDRIEALGLIKTETGYRFPTGTDSREITNPPAEKKALNGWHPDEQQLLVGGFFNRRSSTPWSEKEIKAWRKVGKAPDDLDLLRRYYTAEIPEGNDYRRKDLSTLLNNWSGEIDRARRFCENQDKNGGPIDF
jgi:hypothetical protein